MQTIEGVNLPCINYDYKEFHFEDYKLIHINFNPERIFDVFHTCKPVMTPLCSHSKQFSLKLQDTNPDYHTFDLSVDKLDDLELYKLNGDQFKEHLYTEYFDCNNPACKAVNKEQGIGYAKTAVIADKMRWKCNAKFKFTINSQDGIHSSTLFM